MPSLTLVQWIADVHSNENFKKGDRMTFCRPSQLADFPFSSNLRELGLEGGLSIEDDVSFSSASLLAKIRRHFDSERQKELSTLENIALNVILANVES